jgi:hypothetical protein
MLINGHSVNSRLGLQPEARLIPSLADIQPSLATELYYWPCHSSGRTSMASDRGGPGSRPSQSMWALWWTKCHCDKFFSILVYHLRDEK